MTRNDVDFFAERKDQAKVLRKLPPDELSEFEKELRRTPPFNPRSPLLALVVEERERRSRAPQKRRSIRSVFKDIISRRAKKRKGR